MHGPLSLVQKPSSNSLRPLGQALHPHHGLQALHTSDTLVCPDPGASDLADLSPRILFPAPPILLILTASAQSHLLKRPSFIPLPCSRSFIFFKTISGTP